MKIEITNKSADKQKLFHLASPGASGGDSLLVRRVRPRPRAGRLVVIVVDISTVFLLPQESRGCDHWRRLWLWFSCFETAVKQKLISPRRSLTIIQPTYLRCSILLGVNQLHV